MNRNRLLRVGWGLNLWLCCGVLPGVAQVPGEVVIPPLPPEQWVPSPADRFDLVFNRTFLGGDASDELQVTTTSGTTFIGASFNFYLNKRYSVRLQPGMAFVKYNIRDNDTTEVQLLASQGIESYRLRVFYAELPIAFGLAFRGDSTTGERINSLLEIGATIGYRVSSSIKYEQTLDDDITSKVKLTGVFRDELEPLRIGAFARFSYRFVGIMVHYRFTDVFKSGASSETVSSFPGFSPLEIGLSIHW